LVLDRVGLTGASGMLGRHLLAEFERQDISCLCSSRSRPKRLASGSEWSPWDLGDLISHQDLDRLFPGVQAIVHAGATVPPRPSTETQEVLFDTNVRSALALGEWACARRLPLVFISGAIVYSDPDRTGIKEGDEAGPLGFGGFYGLSKYMGELVFQHFAREGLNLSILRPSSIYGRGLHESKMIAKFLNACMRDEVIELFPPLDDAVDLVHASDVARATTQALEREAYGIYNIASGRMSSVRDVAEACIEVTGLGSLRLTGESKRHPTLRFGLDCSAARASLDFSPRIGLQKGLADIGAAMALGDE
jgi:UDP-glucose 4-epimerase